MSHFLRNIADLEDILCELVEFCVLSEIHVSKTRFKQINENLRLNVYARMFWEPVYKILYPQLHIKQLRKIGSFSSFLVSLSLLARVILHMICYQAFSLFVYSSHGLS